MGEKLLAKLNLFDATLLVVGSVIGSGIFLTSGIIAEVLPHPGWILFVWALGSVLTVFGGLTFAELAGLQPWPWAFPNTCPIFFLSSDFRFICLNGRDFRFPWDKL